MADDESGGTGGVHAALERLNKTPFLAILLWLGAVVGAVAAVGTAVVSLSDRGTAWLTPYQEEYDLVAALDLELGRDYVVQILGTPTSSPDPCGTSTSCREGLTLDVHELAGCSVAVLYQEDRVQLYLVTARDQEFAPHVTWLGHELGPLGQRTLREMTEVPGVEPTGTSARSWMDGASYVEVTAPGAPADYRALILGLEASGAQSLSTSAAGDLAELARLPDDASALSRVRAGMHPNSYGEFWDDGPVAEWLRDPEVVQDLMAHVARR